MARMISTYHQLCHWSSGAEFAPGRYPGQSRKIAPTDTRSRGGCSGPYGWSLK